ncbi:MAG: addiction module protein [Candidatus Riflebacteria bacterium]|nr:addiction module protein [Candidatus Riflebacteria bacterium]
MTEATAKLADKLLSLPCEERIYLVDKLLKSLNAPSKEEIAKAWAEESERRIDEIESGKAQTIPGEQVFRDIRKQLKK